MATSSLPDHTAEPGTEIGWKEKFLQIILKWDESKASHNNIQDKSASFFQGLKDAETAGKKTTLYYRRLKQLYVSEIGGVQTLLK